ncbi:MAG TPA: multifunctional oxoglutarate decarboxylase/oxoglutarate dehydrogenase thiamine pyrophosphate-binding subunit/dihydrolipoyllysine-residue succinyltransferase subunit [Gaiellaceae bacterium]|nr:multifunctional oxoglutarate decarboxylase/oxoglutarate dehydrogenase thiamine pyrophosphate-binding subunit/dihydrolipoyllysine-residue succinyltransferase subunit [Gaiellaceae bacterium]
MAPSPEPSGLNTGYVGQLLEQYLDNPEAVDPVWREFFESADEHVLRALPGLTRLVARRSTDGGNGAPVSAAWIEETTPSGEASARRAEPTLPAEPTAVDEPRESDAEAAAADTELVAGVAAAMSLVKAYRMHGHLNARLDPLGSEPMGDPALDETQLQPSLTPELQARIPSRLLRLSVPGDTLLEALPRLKEVYTGTIAYEIEHISDHAERVWLRQAIETGRFRRPLEPSMRRALLERLAQVEAFETYLRRAFIGQKQFSIEGLDALVPMLDEAIEIAAEGGGHEVLVGIAHRGRLNVLAHTVGRPYESILREFEGERSVDALVSDPEGGTGDVKYHLAASESRTTRAGEVQVTLAANPSHLEAVDPVVEGLARAEQTDRSHGAGVHDPTVALPILIHGDASFAGQGVVAETFNLHSLDGYSTGGTLHVIVNNQVGFTTDPAEGRSTRYSSDLAKGFDVPIIHVNADDPEAALAAISLALAYRAEFGHDVVIDLVGYRRFGHNEQDEAAYTQPLQTGRIEQQVPVRESYAARLVADGVLSEDEAGALLDRTLGELRDVHDALRASFSDPEPQAEPRTRTDTGAQVVTAVTAERLLELTEQLLRVPEGFEVNPKLARQLERRREAMQEGGIDWGHAEALAFASLLEEGIPIRLSGQDTERGTFSHRHAVLHDPRTGETSTPLQQLETASASFEIYNSPLSEFAALGFEHGYSIAAPDALVLWEAQFGDFVNGAQIVVDQFIVSGRSKWGQTSRLTLLLPHGYEGSGPEHSSARLERFLQQAAQDNVRVVNCTTAGQYFHLVRRQALDATARPLVVMTPKGLLRLRQATSTVEDLTSRSFQPTLDDPDADHATASRLVLCSGKVYYDILAHELRSRAQTVAVARIEQLYPFPLEAVSALVTSYPELREIVWAQEEPQNMGAWRSLRHRLEEAAAHAPYAATVQYVGRPWRASPSEGYPGLHLREQDRIVREALGFRAS